MALEKHVGAKLRQEYGLVEELKALGNWIA